MNKSNSLPYLQIITKNSLLETINEIKNFNNTHLNNEIISEYKFNYNLFNYNKPKIDKSPLST